jgi:hypothetical protein
MVAVGARMTVVILSVQYPSVDLGTTLADIVSGSSGFWPSACCRAGVVDRGHRALHNFPITVRERDSNDS